MKLNTVMTPDEKLVYVEPEMEIVAFDQNDIETSPINSDDWWWGDEDNVQGVYGICLTVGNKVCHIVVNPKVIRTDNLKATQHCYWCFLTCFKQQILSVSLKMLCNLSYRITKRNKFRIVWIFRNKPQMCSDMVYTCFFGKIRTIA